MHDSALQIFIHTLFGLANRGSTIQERVIAQVAISVMEFISDHQHKGTSSESLLELLIHKLVENSRELSPGLSGSPQG